VLSGDMFDLWITCKGTYFAICFSECVLRIFKTRSRRNGMIGASQRKRYMMFGFKHATLLSEHLLVYTVSRALLYSKCANSKHERSNHLPQKAPVYFSSNTPFHATTCFAKLINNDCLHEHAQNRSECSSLMPG